MILAKVDIHMQKRKKIGFCIIQYIKSNSKWIKDLRVDPESIKHLEETTGEKHHDIDPHQIVWKKKEIVIKLDCLKLEIVCTVQKALLKLKRQHTNWGKHLNTILWCLVNIEDV